MVGMVLEILPAQGEQHGLGVEWGAVVEANSSAQVKDPNQLIDAHIPALGQERSDNGGFLFVGDQGFVDVVANLEGLPVGLQ